MNEKTKAARESLLELREWACRLNQMARHSPDGMANSDIAAENQRAIWVKVKLLLEHLDGEDARTQSAVEAEKALRKSMEADLLKWQGEHCSDVDCPDHDGQHPFHFNAVEQFWVKVQDTYTGREDSVPAVTVWRRELEKLKLDLERATDRANLAESNVAAMDKLRHAYKMSSDRELAKVLELEKEVASLKSQLQIRISELELAVRRIGSELSAQQASEEAQPTEK